MTDISALVERSYQQSVGKGFHGDPRTVGDLLMLITTEIAEAFEEYRNGHEPGEVYYNNGSSKPEGVGIELADAVIRVMDFCGRYEIDLGQLIELKLDYNLTRSHKHGGKRL